MDIRSYKSKFIISQIRNILFFEWDPAGVSPNVNVSDEYDKYIPNILKALQNDISIEQLVDLLKKIEYDAFETHSNNDTLFTTAHKLKKLNIQRL